MAEARDGEWVGCPEPLAQSTGHQSICFYSTENLQNALAGDLAPLGYPSEENQGILVPISHTVFCLILASVLQKLQESKDQSSVLEESEDWLSTHSLKFEKLTLADLISQGTAMLEESCNVTQKVRFCTHTIHRFESKLSEVIERYQQRIQWLTENSKKVFGSIKGARVGILLDASAFGSGPRKEEFQNDFMSLIDEQLSLKEKLYVLSFGTTINPLWPDPVEVSTFTPDQPSEILSDYIQQSSMGRDLITQVITYRCDDQVPSLARTDPVAILQAILKNLAEALRGYYHCYSPETELYTSRDMDELQAEIQKAQSLLGYMQALHQSNPCEEQACAVKERAMVQFEWHDGTMKNVHVDPPFLYEYQKQLSGALQLYERRIEWLSLASRRIWGTVCEKRVVILLDISVTNSMYIIHIQHSLRLLLEEQMSNKDCFNLIA
ncbi:Hypothetical predicted protein [Marmota monax]|uniref:VWFA domain-containing protein n=1 Tax=Marmota monax TaxID=9995 RepID=A0A5E4CAZ0_MARMO|nr:hypothetical protein GHT09_003401 [Marmota monax]VTJ78885.1 Hypothetical predicted protein [Marmota monax]